MATIVSSTFKIRSAVVESTWKVGGIVSSTFKIESRITSSTFKVSPNVVSSTFRTGTNIVTSTFGVTTAKLDEGVTYATTGDCTKLLVTAHWPGFIAAEVGSVELSMYGSNRDIPTSTETIDGKVTFVAHGIQDGVYTLVVTDISNSVRIRMNMLVVCKLNKCFIEKNDKELNRLLKPTSHSSKNSLRLDPRDTEWLELYVIYRGIIANYRTADYDTVTTLFERAKPFCECNCCETC